MPPAEIKPGRGHRPKRRRRLVWLCVTYFAVAAMIAFAYTLEPSGFWQFVELVGFLICVWRGILYGFLAVNHGP